MSFDSRQSVTSDTEESVGVVDAVLDFVKGVSVPKLLLGSLVGAAGGALLSFVNQTLINPPKQLSLPFATAKLDYLQRRAPELLYAINEFYEFRRFVDRDEFLAEYDSNAEILIDSTMTFVALFDQIRKMRQDLNYTEEFLRKQMPLLTEMRNVFKVIVEAMRRMPLFLSQKDMIQVSASFNMLYSLYADRLNQIKLINEGVSK